MYSPQRIVAFLACLSIVLSQSHHFDYGTKLSGDRQLHYEIVQKSAKPLVKVTKDIEFPAKGTTSAAKVHYLMAYDQYTNDDGGYVSLLEGGLNMTYVTLHFKSKRGHGFNFILEIWGQ